MSAQPYSDTVRGSLDDFLRYSFATDANYQQGLAAVVDGGALQGLEEQARADMLLRSEVYYYNRITGSSVDVEEARGARQRRSTPPSVVNAELHTTSPSIPPAPAVEEGDEPQTLSFAQLKELIEQGRTDHIPNNKVIPNVLSTESPSESHATVRKKPWEMQNVSP